MTLFFIALVLMMAGFWGRVAGRQTAAALTVWLVVTGWAAGAGWLQIGSWPPRIVLVIVPGLLMTVALAFSGWGDALMTRLGVATLIGYQSFRIVVEIFLWWGHREGVVPVQMTWEGRNFDVLTGLLALPLVWMGARAPRWLIAGWNVLGLGLLVNVVSVAVLSIPGPFQQFAAVNWFVAEFPFIWLPAFLVPSALMGHLLVWRWMGRGGSDG